MTRSQDARNRSSLAAPLDPKGLSALGHALQAHFDDLLGEPLPPSFEALLAELERQEPARKKSGNAGR